MHAHNFYGTGDAHFSQFKISDCSEALTVDTNLKDCEKNDRKYLLTRLKAYIVKSTNVLIEKGLVESRNGRFTRSKLFERRYNAGKEPSFRRVGIDLMEINDQTSGGREKSPARSHEDYDVWDLPSDDDFWPLTGPGLSKDPPVTKPMVS